LDHANDNRKSRSILNPFKMNRIIFSFLVLNISVINVQAQLLTLEECQQLTIKNYPLVKQYGLISKSGEYSLSNASKAYLPQVALMGQATYQSEVITFPKGLGSPIPELRKDQYKIAGEISQLVWDAGATRNNRAISAAQTAIETQQVEQELYALKDRINQLYFSILLFDAQLKQNELVQQDIESGIKTTSAAISNGTSFRSHLDELKAALLNEKQTGITIGQTRTAFLEILSVFTGNAIDTSSTFIMPAVPTVSTTVSRPESKLFDLQKDLTDLRQQSVKSGTLPHVSLFFQAAYGAPTFDVINNDFGFYWMGGLKFNWNLSNFYTARNEQYLLTNSRQQIEIQKETFLFNTQLDLTNQNGEIRKYKKLLESDEEIIFLRTSVKNAAAAQLANGVITAHDYLLQVNEEDNAKQTMILHSIYLRKAQYQYKFHQGN
jgi:outer membrane protein